MRPQWRYLTASLESDLIRSSPAQCWREVFIEAPPGKSRRVPPFHNDGTKMEQHKTPTDAASGAVVPLFYMRAPMRPCQENSNMGICEMEQWNKDSTVQEKPRKTRALRPQACSISCSIIVEQWNKPEGCSDSRYLHSTRIKKPDIASRMRMKDARKDPRSVDRFAKTGGYKTLAEWRSLWFNPRHGVF